MAEADVHTSQPSDRVAWLDVARGVSIILVAYYHMVQGFGKAGLLPDLSTLEYLSNAARSISRMPMFFMVSGMLFAMLVPRASGIRVVHRIINIFYLYIIWSVIRIVARFSLGHFGNKAASLEELLLIPVQPPPEMWFFYVLGLLTFTAYVTRLGSRWLVLGVGFALALFSDHVESEIISRFLYFLPPFLIGFHLHGLIRSRAENMQPLVAIGGIAGVLVAFLVLSDSTGHVTFLPAALLLGLAGAMAALPLCVWLARTPLAPVLSHVGKYSLMVYAMSFLFIPGTRVILTELGVTSLLVLTPAVWVAGAAGPLIVYPIMRRVGLEWLFAMPERVFAFLLPSAAGRRQGGVPAAGGGSGGERNAQSLPASSS